MKARKGKPRESFYRRRSSVKSCVSTQDLPREESNDESYDDASNEIISIEDGWFELESDPAVFSSLIDHFGCRDVQVEEVYDLDNPITKTVYGFIFLYNVIDDRSRVRGSNPCPSDATMVLPSPTSSSESPSCLLHGQFILDEKIVNKMFFAHQIIENSCASHAILSVLMNCEHLNIGKSLDELKVCLQNANVMITGFNHFSFAGNDQWLET